MIALVVAWCIVTYVVAGLCWARCMLGGYDFREAASGTIALLLAALAWPVLHVLSVVVVRRRAKAEKARLARVAARDAS